MKTIVAFHIAGILSGAAGLLVFLVLHALTIVPIWFIFPVGLVIAVVGGLAVGWSYAELHDRLPKRPWTTLAITSLIVAILSPALVLAELRPSMFVVSTAGVTNLVMGVPEVIARFIVELLLTSTFMGGLLGWWLGHTRRAAAATALAGFVFALGPGHNIPFIGSTPGVGKEILIMTIVIFVSALVLIEGHSLLQAYFYREKGTQ